MRWTKKTAAAVLLAPALSGCLAPPPAPPPAPAAAAPAAPAGPPTLCDFLGLTPVCELVAAHAKHKLAWLAQHFPCLEPKPPLLPLTDPANAASPIPAVKAAAAVAAAEQAAPQKIKALEYLATVGCGCYEGVTEAFLEALEDCTEPVRFAAVQALYDAAGNPCKVCRSSSCCDPRIREKLQRIGYEMEASGCYYEPSARVRRVARLALEQCGAPLPPIEPEPEPVPEGPPVPVPPPEGPPGPVPVDPDAVPEQPVAKRPTPVVAAAPSEATPAVTPAAGATPSATTASADATVSPDIAANSPDPSPVERAAVPEPLTIQPAGLLPREDAVLAVVGGTKITSGQLSAAITRRLSERRPDDAGDYWKVLRQELESAIARRLVCQEAVQAGWAGTPKDEGVMAAAYLRERVRIDEQVTVEELQAYYEAHRGEFLLPEEVRWERVAASAAELGSMEKARAAVEFVAARVRGKSTTAPAGVELNRVRTEQFDWSRREQFGPSETGSALFEMPVGAVSEVLADDRQCYLVRIIERRPERPAPLEQVAGAIAESIREQRRKQAELEYVEQLRLGAEVWTIFDGPQRPALAGTGDASLIVPSSARQSEKRPDAKAHDLKSKATTAVETSAARQGHWDDPDAYRWKPLPPPAFANPEETARDLRDAADRSRSDGYTEGQFPERNRRPE